MSATMAPNKVIITCAVTGSIHTPSMSPHLPVTPDEIAGEAVAAAIVLAAGATADQESIKAWCRQRMRAEAVPAKLFFLSEFPRNDRGKIVRRDVRVAAENAGAIQ